MAGEVNEAQRLATVPVDSRRDGPAERCVERTAHLIMYNVHMSDLRFEWDEAKARPLPENMECLSKKRRPYFSMTMPFASMTLNHSRDEDHFIMLGMSFKLRMLVVCHCFKKSDSVIRIISARKATRQEAAQYRR